MSKEALELAKKISHNLWDGYDDESGYRSEKQAINSGVSTDDPKNIWFFWGQFDTSNQRHFAVEASVAAADGEAGGEELKDFAVEEMTRINRALDE